MADLIKPRPVITTRNLHEHTAQEVFDFVCTKVIEQGKPSMAAARSRCAYRGDGGLKCAVGHVIDDADYASELDSFALGSGIAAFDPADFEALGWQRQAHRDLMERLQWAHDYAAFDKDFVKSFKENARVVATMEFHLDPHTLDAAMPVEA